jgi:outer membrane immunogenic protein
MGKMTRLLTLICALIIFGAPAFAADLPVAPPRAAAVYVPPPLPVYNWSGFYVGGNGGWGFGTTKWTIPVQTGFPGATGSFSDSGGVAGGTVGVNFQTGGFVFGAEGDWDWSGINTGTTANICNLTGTCQTGNNWLATLRGRFGYAADRVLFYGTAGGAFANIQTTFDGVQTTHEQAGWTAGAGIEWAFADNWTAKVEYLYVNFGSTNFTCSTGVCTGLPITGSVSLTENLVRAGVNFKFNGW